MKSRLFLLAGLAFFSAVVAAVAAPTAAPKPLVSPLAQPVIDRAAAASAALEGWSASIVLEDHIYLNDAETTWKGSLTERFLKGDGSPNFYSYVSDAGGGVPTNVRVQNSEAAYRIDRAPNGRISALLSVPEDDFNRPTLQGRFLQQVAKAKYVRYAGREVVNGQPCDIVETSSITVTPATAEQPASPTYYGTIRFAIDAAGIVVQFKEVANEFADAPVAAGAKPRALRSNWSEWRITHYDTQVRPAKEEFTREAFDRIAASMLKPGEPMPEVREALFRRGERLPDKTFIAWADQQPFRLSDLRGKIVVVETWASWCHFCKEAFPFYEKMRQQLAAQAVVFVAVSFDEKAANYEKWMKANADKYGFKFGLIDAPDPRAAMREFRGSLPAFYVLDRDGAIVGSYIGYGFGAGGEDPRLLQALREAGVKI